MGRSAVRICERMRVAVAAVAVGLLVAAPAEGAVEIGQIQTSPFDNCLAGETWLQGSTAAAPSYTTPPGRGVITSWSTADGTAGATQVKLAVFRPTGAPSQYTTVASSELRALAPGLNTFPATIPVQGGEQIGVLLFMGGYNCNFFSPPAGNRIDADLTPPVHDVGATTTYGDPMPNSRMNLSAIVEPDCDEDELGDETQDPGIPADIAACDASAPDVAITRGPKDKTKKKAATFEFAGTDARVIAGFECSLDGGAFAACSSPHTVKVKKGKHTFSVRAVDQAGNVDGSPATDDWKVKRRKKRK